MKIYQIYNPKDYSEEEIIFQTVSKELAEKILEKLLKTISFVNSSKKMLWNFYETHWAYCKTDEEYNKKLEEKYSLDIRSTENIMLLVGGERKDFDIREVEVFETYSPDIILSKVFSYPPKTKEDEDKVNHFKNMIRGN